MFSAQIISSILVLLAQVPLYQSQSVGSPKTSFRLVNGVPAEQGEFPFMIALTYMALNPFCGGTLISDSYVLTAAHCLYWKMPTEVLVQFGHVSKENWTPETSRNILRFIIHEEYRGAVNDDIALVEFFGSVPGGFEPACLVGQEIGYVGEKLTTIGWGGVKACEESTCSQNLFPDTLQKTTINGLSHDTCIEKIQTDLARYNSETMLCAGRIGTSVCVGDSGGPLLLPKNGKNTQIGITSWGQGCSLSDPSVFVNVAFYIPWIKRKLGGKPLCLN